MSTEDPNKNFKQELVVFRMRLERVKNQLAELEDLMKSRGLSSMFVHNVVHNVLGGMSLEMLELEPDDIELKTMAEEALSLAEEYLDTLNRSEEALQSEASMSFETWLKMGQQETNHAREVVLKFKA